VVQGHMVHVVGMGEMWGRELPGISEGKEDKKKENKDRAEKMKIAWRYEGLGQFESARASPSTTKTLGLCEDGAQETSVFCHAFDLAKRLTLPVGTAVNCIPVPPMTSVSASPFPPILQNLGEKLASTPPHSIHRVVIPSLLSPALYPPFAAHPSSILQFLHSLRAMLRQYPTRLTAIISLPLSLFPRSSGLVRWMEILSDGVLELSPFPYSHMQACT